MSILGKKHIGLVLASIHTGASNGLWSEIAKLAQQHQASLFVFPGGRLEYKGNQEYLRNAIYPLVNTDNLDGIITWASALGGSVSVQEVQAFLSGFGDLACVSIGMKKEGCPVVSFDAYSGVQSVMLHCIKEHHARKLAFLRGPENHYSAEDRYRAYCDTLDQTSLMFDPRLVSDPFAWSEGRQALLQLIEERSLVPGKDFDTLVCSSDLMMFDAGKHLEKLGYRIAKDVRIVGYNDSNESHLLKVPCTTARMPVTELAHMAWNLLDTMLTEENPSCFDILLPSQPIIRRSCGCRYSLGSDEQARQVVGTASSYMAWLLQSFSVQEQDQQTVQQLFKWVSEQQEQALLGDIETLSYRFLDAGGDPNLLSEALHWYCTFFASESFKSDTANQIRDLFLRQRDLVAHEHAYALFLQTKILDELKCDLLGVRTLSAIPALLANHLKSLGLDEGYLVLHDTDMESLFVGGYTRTTILAQQQRFSKHLLLPPALLGRLGEGVYVAEPLFMDSQPLGYLIIRTTLFSGSVMEELRTALSSAVKGALLLDRANRAREEAEQAQRSRSEFFANVSEGLRNPLEEILTLVEGEDSVLKEQVGLQIRSAQHLLDLTLSHTGEFALERKLFDLKTILYHLEKAQKLQWDTRTNLPLLLGDAQRIKEAFEIVCDHIHQQGGMVNLGVLLLGEGILCTFSSSQPTWQASLSRQDLSLSLAQRIVLMSGGVVFFQDNQILFRLPWPSLEGESLPAVRDTLYYLSGDDEKDIPPLFAPFPHSVLLPVSSLDKQQLSQLEGGLLGWDGRRTNGELVLALQVLSRHALLSKSPMVCFHAPCGHESLISSLSACRFGTEQGLLVLVGSFGEALASELGMVDKVLYSNTEQLLEVYEHHDVSLLVSDSFVPGLYEEIRKRSAAPIVIIRESWKREEAEALSLIPHLVIAHRSVEESREFFVRLLSLLSHQEVLPPLTGALVKRAVVYLQEHATNQISRWQLAEAINVSEDYLTRIFRKELGLSPWEYLNRYRIFLATKLLKQTTLTINEVANQTGFQDQAYFCRVFRKIRGCAPGKVRSR